MSRPPARLRRSLSRRWRRFLGALLPSRAELVLAPEAQVGVGSTPIDPRRSQHALAFLRFAGLIGPQSVHRPRRASLRELLLVHTEEYLEELRGPESMLPVLGFEVSPEVHQTLLDSQRFAVGGTLLAGRLALRKRKPVFHCAGGLHHARPGSGRGFCIFNDVAVAIRVLRKDGFAEPVLVVDLDLHDGDGTRIAFAEDDSVFTFSIHNRPWDPAPATASLSIELEGDLEDEEYFETLDAHLEGLFSEVEPGLVFFNAGVDIAHDDRLGNWKISHEGVLARDRRVFDITSRLAIPTVTVLGGGYGRHAWRYTAGTLAWLLAGWKDPDLPSTGALTLSRYRRDVAFVGPTGDPSGSRPASDAKDDAADDPWALSAEDIYGELGAAPKRSLFLDAVTPHAIELALEQSGLLDRLRTIGYRHPTLRFDLENPGGQTIQIFTDPERSDRLVEIRLSRDRASLPEMQLLAIEWLLLQNPSADFTRERAALPGQKHPGLGILPDVMALLVLLCEQLQLDGILFIPSHFHLAAQGKRYLRFLRPEDEAWFLALGEAVAHLPLAQATKVVERGEIVDAAGENVGWRPMPMVVPISKRLKAEAANQEFDEQVQAAKSRLHFRIKPDQPSATPR